MKHSKDKSTTTTTTKPLVNMRTAVIRIRGIAPLAWTKRIAKKGDNEDASEYEQKMWRQKVHLEDGFVSIPSIGLRNSIAEGGRDIPIPGKGSARAKNLIMVATLPPTAFYKTDKASDDLRAEWKDMTANPSKGKGGRGARVPKLVPMLDPGWECEARLIVIDDRITDEMLRTAIARGGLICGVGALRVETGGVLGRYELIDLTWE